MNRFACRILVPFEQLANFKVLVTDGQLQVACQGISNLLKEGLLGLAYILYVDTNDPEYPDQTDIYLLEEHGCKVEDIHEREIADILAKYFPA